MSEKEQKNLSKTKNRLALFVAILFIVIGIYIFSTYKFQICHILTISLSLLFVCMCIVIPIIFSDDENKEQYICIDKDNDQTEKNNAEIETRLCYYIDKKQKWFICYLIWLAVYYYTCGMSILSSCIIIYIANDTIDNNAQEIIIFYSIIALLLTFLNLLIKPLDGSKGYRKAYIRMEKDILDFQNGNADFKKLNESFVQCENYITKGLY